MAIYPGQQSTDGQRLNVVTQIEKPLKYRAGEFQNSNIQSLISNR